MPVSLIIREHKHCARQNRCAVCNDIFAARRLADRLRRPVVRVYTHAAGAQNHIRTCFEEPPDSQNFLCRVIAGHVLSYNFTVKRRKLVQNDRRKCILNPVIQNLVSRCDDPDFLMHERQERQNLSVRHRPLRGFHLFLLDDERNDPHSREPVPGSDNRIAVARRDHHLPL